LVLEPDQRLEQLSQLSDGCNLLVTSHTQFEAIAAKFALQKQRKI
jgi:hypothetical protein